MDFGEQFARMRSSRRLSQERLARLAGVSRQTIVSAEASAECRLNASTSLLILKAFASANPPLNAEEAAWLAAQAGLDRAAALALVPVSPMQGEQEAVGTAVSDLLTLVGPALAGELLAAIVKTIRASRQPAATAPRARGLIVKHAPVQREGFTEQIEVEYTERPLGPAAPGTTAAGF